MATKPGKGAKSEAAAERAERLKAALKANLRKRKNQAKARDNKEAADGLNSRQG
jgi:hypothetical protein